MPTPYLQSYILTYIIHMLVDQQTQLPGPGKVYQSNKKQLKHTNSASSDFCTFTNDKALVSLCSFFHIFSFFHKIKFWGFANNYFSVLGLYGRNFSHLTSPVIDPLLLIASYEVSVYVHCMYILCVDCTIYIEEYTYVSNFY